jgi:hypothetical protein
MSRLIVLFVALAVLKVILTVGQGQSLYEAHWRTNGVPESRVNVAAFCAFILLGGLSLASIAKRSQEIGTKAVRTLNASVLLLGLVFIFLTFHNGNKNYFYPILNGVLKWSSLGPYFANSLFFNQPFLAAWIFVYGISYYVMARTGREKWVLWLTATFGCAYALIHLRELMGRRDELLVVDSLCLLSLFMNWRLNCRKNASGVRLSPGWLLLPLSWTLFYGWALLRFDSEWHTTPAAYFLGLISVTLTLFILATVVIREWGEPVAWSWFAPVFLVAFWLLTDANYPTSENYNHLACLALTFPRYLTGELAVVAMVGLGAVAYRKVRPRGGFWWLDLLCLAIIAVAGIDLRLSQIMGVRLGWDVLSFGDSPKMMLRMAKPYLPGAFAGLAVAGGIYFVATLAIQAWIGRGEPEHMRDSGPSTCPKHSAAAARPYIAAVFVALGLLGLAIAESDKAEGQAVGRLVRSSPLWKQVANRPMNREEFGKSASALGLGDFNTGRPVSPMQKPRDLNVVVVFMESSYNKHLSLFGSSEETQPLLTKYRDRMEVFPNFFSAFAGSIHARFATFTSLYPVCDFHAFTQERVPVKSLFEVLHEAGYTCSMFYSSYFDYTGFRDFLKNRGLDEMYDADTMPGQRGSERVEWGLLEEETLGAIRAQLQKYAQTKQRFCLTYVPAAPHNPFDKIPKAFRKFTMKEVGDFTPLYLNELLYMDWVLASIVDQLKESGLLEHTLVVITNDHGEMLGGKEDGHIGHGWAMTPQLANTPLIIMDPDRLGFQVNKTIGTQVDFLPTILDRLHIPVPADQLYEGQSLDAAPDRRARLGYANSYKQFAIIEGDKISLGDRESSNPSGVASKGAVFTISNEGAKTLFHEVEETGAATDRLKAMARFDAFQESLLRNYSYYCGEVRKPEQPLAKGQDR